MNCDAYKRELLEHYVCMSSLPWAKAAAWQSANELAREHPCLFSDLPELLKQAMLERKSSE